MFEQYYDPEFVKSVLLPKEEYRPFPKSAEEGKLPAELVEKMIRTGEEYLNYTWPVALCTDYMKYVLEGTRQPYEHGNYQARRRALSALMDAELCERKGRFINDIINGMWAIMDEATWVVPAHNYHMLVMGHDVNILPDFDEPIGIALFSAGTAGLLSNCYYLFKEQLDAITPLICRRLEKVLKERIFDPFLANDYGWTGLKSGKSANWNPWIISNILSCFALVCPDAELRAKGIAHACHVVDMFVHGYHEEGGCDEGPSYWNMAGGALFDCLSELSQMTGEAFDIYFQEEKIRNIARYIYRVHINENYFTNYADAPLRSIPSPDLVYRFGKKIQDPKMVDMGIFLYDLQQRVDDNMRNFGNLYSSYRYMKSVFSFVDLNNEPRKNAPLVQSSYIADVQVTCQRMEEGSVKGLFLTAKGGTNSDSHNHNDVGSYMIYSDGVPAIMDIGSGQYNRQTFGPHRYEIMQMNAGYHNLPIINGVVERNGKNYDHLTDIRANRVSYVEEEQKKAVFSVGLDKMYGPEAGMSMAQRTFIYDRENACIILKDEMELTGEKNEVQFVFMTHQKPDLAEGTLTIHLVDAPDVQVTFDPSLKVAIEEIDISHDEGLVRSWKDRICRTLFTLECGTKLENQFVITQL